MLRLTLLDVRPLQHIGLATISYLFYGEVMHRDSPGGPGPRGGQPLPAHYAQYLGFVLDATAVDVATTDAAAHRKYRQPAGAIQSARRTRCIPAASLVLEARQLTLADGLLCEFVK